MVVIVYINRNFDKEVLKKLRIHPVKKLKYNLRALPNELSNGISTSLVFSGWNAATYVNQMDDNKISEAERNNLYQKVTQDIVKKNNGLWFYDELLAISKK